MAASKGSDIDAAAEDSSIAFDSQAELHIPQTAPPVSQAPSQSNTSPFSAVDVVIPDDPWDDNVNMPTMPSSLRSNMPEQLRPGESQFVSSSTAEHVAPVQSLRPEAGTFHSPQVAQEPERELTTPTRPFQLSEAVFNALTHQVADLQAQVEEQK